MNLYQALLQPQFVGLSDVQCLTAGNVVSLYAPNHTLYTYSGLGAALESASVDQSTLLDLPGFIQSLTGGASLHVFLLSGGCDFSLPAVQAQLTANVPGASAINRTALNAMIALGGASGTV